jgi:hypothetical protein
MPIHYYLLPALLLIIARASSLVRYGMELHYARHVFDKVGHDPASLNAAAVFVGAITGAVRKARVSYPQSDTALSASSSQPAAAALATVSTDASSLAGASGAGSLASRRTGPEDVTGYTLTLAETSLWPVA